MKLFFILPAFLGLFYTTSGNPLIGEPHYCKREGAVVKTTSWLQDYNSCFLCTCVNHMVVCTRSSCPSLDGCYRVVPQKNSECCSSCMGCIHNGTRIAHGNSWSSDCMQHDCVSGVLTTSESRCHTPCANPLPPNPDYCCPRCKDCWVNGQLLSEGESKALYDDPCVKCTCEDGHLSCVKKSCPVLSCPPNKAVIDKDGCCPVCNGSREIFMLPGGRCFLGSHLYRNGANHTHDPCTTCVCDMGYLQCQRQSCPPLMCPLKYQVHTEGQCCPSCVYPKQSQMCSFAGVHKSHEETWLLDKCTSCSCNHGSVVCQVEHCDYMVKECPRGFRKIQPVVACCPYCEREHGVCLVYGDAHYKTFDGLHFDYYGDCRYVLAKDCGNGRGGKFSIRLNNDARPSPYFAWRRSLVVKLGTSGGGRKISMSQKLRTKVDGNRIKFPYSDPDLNITRSGFHLSLTTYLGVEVDWDGAKYVEVKIHPKWLNQTCGFCGNFNGNLTDDRLSRSGELMPTEEKMASSWLSGKRSSCLKRLKKFSLKSNISDTQVRTQRLTCSKSHNETQERCSIFNGTFFDRCRLKVPVDSFRRSCYLDLCDCSNPASCECDSIVAYVRECERTNVSVAGWKSVTKCGGLECPYGSVFMTCAPACKPSCTKTPNPDCHMRRCKAGCYCPPPTVLHKGYCIRPENCPIRNPRKTTRWRPF